MSSNFISDLWVSSDSENILDISERFGAKIIKRSEDISGDTSSSESAWIHAINFIERDKKIDLVIAPQVTSPLREARDIDNAIELFHKEKYDSMFSSCISDDLYFWKYNETKSLQSVNYDYLKRRRRQDEQQQIIENGSFYLFKPEIIKKTNNRFGGKIGYSKMDFWKMFEIDNLTDLRMCSALMREFLIKE